LACFSLLHVQHQIADRWSGHFQSNNSCQAHKSTFHMHADSFVVEKTGF
jgi:hypothetical protein